MNGPLTGWRVLLRIAWRDVLRNKGRSALILVMIALPVFGVTAAHVVISTSDVTTREGLTRYLGAADARIDVEYGQVYQGPDPYDYDNVGWGSYGENEAVRSASESDLQRVLGDAAELHGWREDVATARVNGKSVPLEASSADLREDAFRGTYELTAGRVAERPGEVVVNSYVIARGAHLGGELTIVGRDEPLEIVGVAEDAFNREPGHAWALPQTFQPTGPGGVNRYLVEVPGGVDWETVLELNEIGALVLSREVMDDPPSKAEMELPGDPRNYMSSGDEYLITTVVLVATMALLEIILLAGPSFAVGARRMHRTLAQVAANGGSPRQVRRAVLATAVVLGGIAAGAGLVLGIGLAAICAPIAQQFSSQVFGPFDVVWLHVLAIAALGWLSAVVAAMVPAWIASRLDVVKVLAGRRGDAAPSKASPVLGLVLFGLGAVVAVMGTRRPSGELFVAASAILIVLGSVLLLSPTIALVGRIARRAPLPLRYAVRDAARHRTRTIPAVGAVLATVAGVVALGIANASDQEESKQTYEPRTASGAALVSFYDEVLTEEEYAEAWSTVEEVAKKFDPQAELVRGISMSGASGVRETDVQIGDEAFLLSSYGGDYGSWIVADSLPSAEFFIDDADKASAMQALAAGEVVLFADPYSERMAADVGRKLVRPDKVKLDVVQFDGRGNGETTRTVAVDVTVVDVLRGTAQGIVPTKVARDLGALVRPTTVFVPGPLSRVEQADLKAELRKATDVANVGVYVERGWTGDGETRLMMLILLVVGGFLMIAGTLTATFLALSDAAPDLATLSAVGAAPRERRLVAAAYALVVGGLGALVGAVVGLIPGIAATWPLTTNGWSPDGVTRHYLAIPWALIAVVVVGLPLLTALVVGLCARSRLPLVARID